MNEFYNAAVPQALRQIRNLSEPQYQVLRNAVVSPEGFDDQYARCRRLASELGGGLNAHDVVKMLGALWYLKGRLGDWVEQQGEDTSTAIHELLEFIGVDRELGDDLDRPLFTRLFELLAERPDEAARADSHRLRTGLIDTVINFDSFVDLRPRFSADISSVEEFIPMVIFRIAVERDFGSDGCYVFQMTPEHIEGFRAVLDDVQDQLTTLSTIKELGLRSHMLPSADEEI